MHAAEFAGPAFAPTADLSLPWEEREKAASVAVFEGESVESVRKIVEADTFYTGDVVSCGSTFREGMR